MELLDKSKLTESLDSNEDDSIFIDPLLSKKKQIGEVTIDLRLGYDFLVSILTRKPYIEISQRDEHFRRGVSTYFQVTRRDLGDKFVLYPNQVVLTTTLEYVSLPSNIYADILSRSSYTRLGIHLNTMVQPGFRGCISIELFNQSNNPVELIVGSRILQARFFKIGNSTQYMGDLGEKRKYYGNVRPTVSKAESDKDIEILKKARLLDI